MMKQLKLIEVEKLRPLNPKKDGVFLMIFRQAICMALEQERYNMAKPERREGKP